MEDELIQQFNEMSIHNVETDINTITASIKGMSFHMKRANEGNLTADQNKLMNMYAKVILTCKKQLTFIENSLRSPVEAKKQCDMLFHTPTRKQNNEIKNTFGSPLSTTSAVTVSSGERVLFTKMDNEQKKELWVAFAKNIPKDKEHESMTKKKLEELNFDAVEMKYVHHIDNKDKDNESIVIETATIGTTKLATMYNTYFPRAKDGVMASTIKKVFNPLLDITQLPEEKLSKAVFGGKHVKKLSDGELYMQSIEEFTDFMRKMYNKDDTADIATLLDCYYSHLTTGINNHVAVSPKKKVIKTRPAISVSTSLEEA
jgi:hypothetical protein